MSHACDSDKSVACDVVPCEAPRAGSPRWATRKHRPASWAAATTRRDEPAGSRDTPTPPPAVRWTLPPGAARIARAHSLPGHSPQRLLPALGRHGRPCAPPPPRTPAWPLHWDCPDTTGAGSTPPSGGVVYSWGRAGIAADIRYAFGTPLFGSKRRPMPDAMPQRQHTR